MEHKVQARKQVADKEFRNVLLLQEPVETVETVEKVKDMVKAGSINGRESDEVEPMLNFNAEQATFTGYRAGEEVEGQTIEVCK